jgi:hypothetical protein
MKYLVAILFLTGCGSIQVEKPKEPELKQVKNIWPNKSMDEAAKDAISLYGQSLLTSKPADIDSWCLDFSKVDKVGFYSAMLSHMSKYESNFKTELQYKEKFTDDSGKNVISRGLLQVSFESCLKGYKVQLKTGEELHDPVKNLECSVKILNRLVPENNLVSAKVDGKYKGAARYWAVMRPESKLSLIKSGVMEGCK